MSASHAGPTEDPGLLLQFAALGALVLSAVDATLAEDRVVYIAYIAVAALNAAAAVAARTGFIRMSAIVLFTGAQLIPYLGVRDPQLPVPLSVGMVWTLGGIALAAVTLGGKDYAALMCVHLAAFAGVLFTSPLEGTRQVRALIITTVAVTAAGLLAAAVRRQKGESARHIADLERARDDLARAHERYRDLFDNIEELICVHDTEGRVLEVNPSTVRTFGLRSADEIVGHRLDEFVPEEFRSQVPLYLAQIARAGRASGLMSIVTTTGEHRVLEYQNTLHEEPSGTRVVRGVSRDVSDPIRIERLLDQLQQQLESRVQERTAELSASELRYRALANLAPVGIFRTDAKGRCVYVNSRWCAVTGLDENQALGTGWSATLHPDDRDTVMSAWDAAARAGRRFAMEYRFQRPDGQVVWVYGESDRETDAAGLTIGYVGAVTDVTSGRLREDARSHVGTGAASRTTGQAFFEEVVHTLCGLFSSEIAFVAEIDADGRLGTLAMAVDGQLWPRFTYDPQGTPCEDVVRGAHVVHTDGLQARFPDDLDLSELGAEAYAAVPLTRTDGSVIGHLGVMFRRSLPGSANVLPALEIFAVRTGAEIERQQHDAELRRVLAEREALLREIHHRVKNNLQVVSSLLDMQAEAIGDPAARDALQESRNRVRSMAAVHEQLYNGNGLASVDLAEYVRTLLPGMFRAYNAGEHIRLELDLERVSVAPETALPIGLILNEAVSNALKHGFPERRPGTIKVVLRGAGVSGCTLAVSDSGIGFGMDDTRPRQSLGLQLIESLARQLRGRLDISGTCGTTITVVCPSAKEEAELVSG